MPNHQFAHGLFAGFGTIENPFQSPNGMEENLRLLDDHIALHTLAEPQEPGTAYPGTASDGDAQIYTDGSYAVLNGGAWKLYPPRAGLIATCIGQGSWRNSGHGWEDAVPLHSLVFLQAGVGSVPRRMDEKLWDLAINPEDKGAVGDGRDDTAALQRTLDIASGRVVRLGQNKVYGITTLNIPPNVVLDTNGSKFRKLVPSNTYAITGGLRLIADRLWLTSAGAPTDNGVYLDGGSMQIGQVRIEFDNPGAGSDAGLYNAALMIGPDDSAGTSVSQDQIGSLLIRNHIYPVIYRNVRQMRAGMHQINGYRRAVYLRNVQDSVFFGASISGMAPNVLGHAGDNGLLMEAYYDGGCSNNVFYGWHVYDSGEHGFRLGGQSPIRNQWFYGCSATRPGSGTDATGGSGFKAQGSSGASWHYNIHLIDFVGEDGNYMGGNGPGVMYSLVDGGTIQNLTVRKRANAQSFWHGLSIDEINNLTVTNPKLLDCRQYCFRATANQAAGFPQGMVDVLVEGGIMKPQSSGLAISIDSYSDVGIGVELRRFHIRGVIVAGGYQVAKVQPLVAGGSFNDCSMDFTYSDSTGAGGVTDGTDGWMMTMRLNAVNLLVPAKRGSTQIIQGSTRFYKNSLGWSSEPNTYIANMADGAVLTISVDKSSGQVVISTTGLAYFGQAFYRTNTPATVKLNGGSNFAVTTGPLSGATGAAGNMTFSVDANNVYLENRAGSTQSVFITIN
jgi:hypothetical protein